MKRTLIRLALILLAIAAGFGASELAFRTESGRELMARFVRSGSSIVLENNLRDAAQSEAIDDAAIDHEIEVFRGQFGDDARMDEVLRRAGLSLGEWRTRVAQHLRERAWIEQQVAPQLTVSDSDLRAFYESHRAQFTQPLRYRASHLFLAAPDGCPQEVLEAKRSEIEALSIRRMAGEDFAALIKEASEDEATKTRGGDLGYFAERRMPPGFFAELKKLQVGQISGPIHSHLGFHLVQLTDAKPQRPLSFAEVRGEIALALADQRRAHAVASLRARLRTPEFAVH